MSDNEKHIKTIFIMLLIGLLTAVLGYALRIYLARTYSVTDYGMVYATLAFFLLIMSFMDLGVSQALVRVIAKHRSKNDVKGVRTAFISVLFFEICAVFIISILFYFFSGIISSVFLHSNNVLFFKILIVWFCTMPLYSLCVAYMFGYEKPRWWSYAELLKILLVLLITLVMEFLGLGILSVAVGFGMVHLLIFVIFYSKIKFIFQPPFSIKFRVFWGTLKYGLLISVGTLGWMIFSQSDTLIITYFKGVDAAGLYQVAVPIATLLTFFITPISSTLYSSISTLWFKSKKREIVELCSLILRFALMLLMPVVLTMSLFSKIIIRLLFGEAYVGASNALIILSWAFFFILLSTVLYSVLSAIGQAKNAAKVVIITSVLNILGCVILVNVWGIEGVAFSTLVSGVILFFLLFRNLQKVIVIKLPTIVWFKTVISGILFSLVILLVKRILVMNDIWEAIICLVMASAIFILNLFVLKVISISQLKQFIKILFSK